MQIKDGKNLKRLAKMGLKNELESRVFYVMKLYAQKRRFFLLLCQKNELGIDQKCKTLRKFIADSKN